MVLSVVSPLDRLLVSLCQVFLDQETRMLKDMVEKVKKAGANVLICQRASMT